MTNIQLHLNICTSAERPFFGFRSQVLLRTVVLLSFAADAAQGEAEWAWSCTCADGSRRGFQKPMGPVCATLLESLSESVITSWLDRSLRIYGGYGVIAYFHTFYIQSA